ncbi:MAG: tRNA dihydrouridine synthase DusB [Krumholzibacteria bacterium]|nr:tRNA dihydrouridine synthase DusB [Candidatus Krumholzibacteria bacterium]
MPDRLDRKPVRLDPRLPWLARTRRFLSPMAGVTDRPFRTVCRRFGADIGFCEFVSATGLTYGGEGSWKLVDTDGEQGLVGVQIFGSDPEHMGQAARLLMDHQMDVLDINFGCPVKKVVRKCGGSALLADVPLLERIVRAVVGASTVPVTAKIRTGWDEDSVNYREVGLLLQELGLPWVTLHGRTRAQLYTGEADWDRIADLVATLDIPVIGNGDVTDGQSYARLVRHTRCHGVMVARGAIGNPWLFAQMRAVDEGTAYDPPTFAAMCEVLIEHIRGEVAAKGERIGSQTVRKHVARCFKGRPGAAHLRKAVFAEDTSEGMIAVIAAAAARGEPALAGEAGRDG